jgi:hypothetical protein
MLAGMCRFRFEQVLTLLGDEDVLAVQPLLPNCSSVCIASCLSLGRIRTLGGDFAAFHLLAVTSIVATASIDGVVTGASYEFIIAGVSVKLIIAVIP